MPSLGKVAALWRTVFRNPRGLTAPVWHRAVGTGVLGSVVGTGLLCYYRYNANNRSLPPFVVHAEEHKKAPAPQMSARRMRFIQFASVAYEQEPYMTPRDFLYSVMLEKVDRKLQKKVMTKDEVNSMLVAASKARAGNDLFRNLGDDGLISYTEYVFLLTILTKPRTGFHIAFKMLDVDGNEHVDQKEFMTLKKIIGKSKWRAAKDITEKPAEEGEGVNTTLQAYFFGKRGDNKLQYKEFRM